MVLFAGPVFPEWYWAPLFFLIVFSPVLAAAAAGADVVARRLRGPLPEWTRIRIWIVAATAATAVILAIGALRDHLSFERDSRRAAQTIDFTLYEPQALPDGMDEKLVRADDHRLPYLVSWYEGPGGAYAFAYQQQPEELSLQPGACRIHDLQGTGTSFFDGACEQRPTPSGRTVFTGESGSTVGGREAFALIGGTLVRLSSVGLAEPTVLAWFDSLRPVAVDEIDFKRP